MKKTIKNLIIAFMSIVIVVFCLSSCTVKCDAYPTDKTEWLPDNYRNAECVYVSGAERIVCNGSDIEFSGKYTKEKCKCSCLAAAKMQINNDEMFINCELVISGFEGSGGGSDVFIPEIYLGISYKDYYNGFSTFNYSYSDDYKIFYPEIVLQNQTYTNVLRFAKNVFTYRTIDTLYYAQHYGVVQFTDTAGRTWHLER